MTRRRNIQVETLRTRAQTLRTLLRQQTGPVTDGLVQQTAGAAAFSLADRTKLNGIETGATADQTQAEIVTLWELETALDTTLLLEIVAQASFTQTYSTAAATVDDPMTVTYTTNDPSITPDGAITVADGSAPTNAELLEFCEELRAENTALRQLINEIIDNLQDNGLAT